MNDINKVAVFAAGLALTFGASFGISHAVGPGRHLPCLRRLRFLRQHRSDPGCGHLRRRRQPSPLPAPARTATVDGYTVTLAGDLTAGKAGMLTLSVARAPTRSPTFSPISAPTDTWSPCARAIWPISTCTRGRSRRCNHSCRSRHLVPRRSPQHRHLPPLLGLPARRSSSHPAQFTVVAGASTAATPSTPEQSGHSH